LIWIKLKKKKEIDLRCNTFLGYLTIFTLYLLQANHRDFL